MIDLVLGFSSRGESIELQSVWLKKGDIVVLGTNGLFDNMWDDEIVSTVNQTMGVKMGDQHADEVSTELVPTTTMPLEKLIHPGAIAEALVSKAAENSKNVEKKSPFAESAEKQGFIYLGGLQDDITAVVAHIVPSN